MLNHCFILARILTNRVRCFHKVRLSFQCMFNKTIFLSGHKWRKKSIFLQKCRVSCPVKYRHLCWFHMSRCVRYFSWHGLKWLKGKKRELDNRHTADTEHVVEEFLYRWKRHHCTHTHTQQSSQQRGFCLIWEEQSVWRTKPNTSLHWTWKRKRVTWWDESVVAPLSASRYRDSQLSSKIARAQQEIEP